MKQVLTRDPGRHVRRPLDRRERVRARTSSSGSARPTATTRSSGSAARLRAQMPFLDPVEVVAGQAQAVGHDARARPDERARTPARRARSSPAGSVRIFDTTLRDGEQAPGAGLTAAEKLEVARQLARLKVDVIEAGFPAASPGDFEAVRRIAQETRGGIAVAALARCKDGDPQRAIEAIKVAERPHLHVFIATSDIHLKHKLRIDRETALAEAVRWVRYGREQLGPRRRDRVLAPRTPRAPTSTTCCRSTRRSSRPARRRSTSRTPSATRSRPSSGRWSSGSSSSSATRRRSASTATTTSASPRPTRSPRSRPARARSRSRSTASASAPATRRSRRSSWPSGRARRSSRTLGSRRPDRADHRRQPAGELPDRVRDPAEQGDRRRQRVRPRVGHPPGRRDQEPADLRDHDPAVGRAVRQPADDRQAVRAGAASRASSSELGYELEGEALDDDLPPGDRPRRRQEGGHRRRPPRARRAARVRGAGLASRSSAGA